MQPTQQKQQQQQQQQAASLKPELATLRGLFLLLFLEVSSVGLIAARLPQLLTTELARQQQLGAEDGGGSLAYHGSGRCHVALAWLPPTRAQVVSNTSAAAARCAAGSDGEAEGFGIEPCCTEDGTLAFPNSCPSGGGALACVSQQLANPSLPLGLPSAT